MTERPEGMVPISEFAKVKGYTLKDAISALEAGVFEGSKIGEEWYVRMPERRGSGPTKRTNRPDSAAEQIRTTPLGTASAIAAASASNEPHRKVVVTDIQMPFGSMVAFMVKWSIASIPAFIILFVLMFIVTLLFSGVIGGLLLSTVS